MEMEPLWPKDIGSLRVQAPFTILKLQATQLGNITKNLVEAEVNSANPYNYSISNNKTDFAYEFSIVAPAIDNYRYPVFGITYDINLYPLKLYLFDKDLKNQLKFYSEEEFLLIGSESVFIDTLRQIFNSDKVKRVINTLLSQSTEP